jgi:Zn-dependent protease
MENQEPQEWIGPVQRPAEPQSGGWKKGATTVGGIGVLLVKFLAKGKAALILFGKFLPALLKTGGTMMLSVWVYALQWGWWFSLGFVVLIFIHECGHLIAARKNGLNVGAPVFIPFMGAFIALRDAPANAWVEFEVAAGGPIAGAMAAAACHLTYLQGGPEIFGALAYIGYMLNLFNMLPVSFLDGGRMVKAISPWLWLPGMALGVWWVIERPNMLLAIILVMGLPQVFRLFRKGGANHEFAQALAPGQRLAAGAVYFGMIAALAGAMHLVDMRLHPERTKSHPERSQANR